MSRFFSDDFLNQNSLLFVKKRRGATHTEAKGSVDDLCGGTEQTGNNGTGRKACVIYLVVVAAYLIDEKWQVLANDQGVQNLGSTIHVDGWGVIIRRR